MSHFVKQTTTRRIRFAPGHELHGLEMQTKGADIRFMAAVARVFADLQAAGQDGIAAGSATADDMDRIAALVDEALRLFASKLTWWNMRTEDGADVPPTAEGMHSLEDDEYVMGLIKEWLTVLAGVPQDLGKDSGSGETSPVLSLPMDVLSPSPAS